MTLGDFYKKVAKKSGMTQDQTKVAVNAVFDSVVELLKDHEELTVPNFGKFFAKFKEERESMNIVKGEKELVPAHYVPVLKFGPKIKEAVR